MGVDHRGFHILMAQEFLHRPDIVTAFQKLCGKGMAEGVAGRPFGEAGLANGLLERLLQDGFIHMMPSFLAGLQVFPPLLLWEDPLPAPVS